MGSTRQFKSAPGRPQVSSEVAMALLDASRENPFRSLDWRWQLARQTRSPSRSRKLQGDDWTRRAHGLHAAAARLAGDPERPRVARVDPAVSEAHRLVRGDPTLRLQLECRLLAGQEDAAIAGDCGLGPDVVAAYAALFFDVRPLLAHQDALLFSVFGEQLDKADGGGPVIALKLLTYFGGPVAADTLLPGIRLDQTGVPVLADARLDGLFRKFVDVRAMPNHGHGAVLTLRLHGHLAGRVGVTAPARPDIAELLRKQVGAPGTSTPDGAPAGPTILAAVETTPVNDRAFEARAAG